MMEGLHRVGRWLGREAFDGGTGLFDGEEEVGHRFSNVVDIHFDHHFPPWSLRGHNPVGDFDAIPVHADADEPLVVPAPRRGEEKVVVRQLKIEHAIIGQFAKRCEDAKHVLSEETIPRAGMLGCGKILSPRALSVFVF